MAGGRSIGFVFLIAIGVTGMASVVLHAVVGPGNLPCCQAGALGDWLTPIIAGVVVGAPIAVAIGQSDKRRPTEGVVGCPRCGSAMRDGWRLCPECGNILGGDA